MSSAAERARKCFAVAARPTTLPGERDAAIARGMAIIESHALNPDHFDIPGRARNARRASVDLDPAMHAAMQQAMADMAARLKAEMAARGLAERLMRERARAGSPFTFNAAA